MDRHRLDHEQTYPPPPLCRTCGTRGWNAIIILPLLLLLLLLFSLLGSRASFDPPVVVRGRRTIGLRPITTRWKTLVGRFSNVYKLLSYGRFLLWFAVCRLGVCVCAFFIALKAQICLRVRAPIYATCGRRANRGL